MNINEKNVSQTNPSVQKEYILSEIYPSNARLLYIFQKLMKFTALTREKPQDHLTWSKSFCKVHHPFMINIPCKLEMQREALSLIKDI